MYNPTNRQAKLQCKVPNICLLSLSQTLVSLSLTFSLRTPISFKSILEVSCWKLH